MNPRAIVFMLFLSSNEHQWGGRGNLTTYLDKNNVKIMMLINYCIMIIIFIIKKVEKKNCLAYYMLSICIKDDDDPFRWDMEGPNSLWQKIKANFDVSSFVDGVLVVVVAS